MENASERLVIRKLRENDIPTAMHLKDLAGWNQLESDWRALLVLEPNGCFAGELGKNVVATATAINYGGPIGWIGMILVEPAFRRRGIATRMMHRSIQYLENAGCQCPKLDATDAGAQVYSRFGFRTEYLVERWALEGSPHTHTANSTVRLRRAEPSDLTTILGLDVAAFGADRSRLLHWYLKHDTPGFVQESDGETLGYVLSRRGRTAVQMGPMVAEDPGTAGQLMAQWLATTSGAPIIADIIASHHSAPKLMHRFGFKRSRILQRMYRADSPVVGDPEKIYCLAGFEFG